MSETKKPWIACLKSIIYSSLASLGVFMLFAWVIGAVFNEIKPEWLREMTLHVVMMVMYLFASAFAFFFFGKRTFYLLYPFGGKGGSVKVKQIGIQQIINVYFGVICFYYSCGRVQSVDNLFNLVLFFAAYFVYFIKYYYITEFYLLYYQIFYIAFLQSVSGKIVSAAEFAFQSQSVYYRHHAV